MRVYIIHIYINDRISVYRKMQQLFSAAFFHASGKPMCLTIYFLFKRVKVQIAAITNVVVSNRLVTTVIKFI